MNTALLHSLVVGGPLSIATNNQLNMLFNKYLPEPANDRQLSTTTAQQSTIYSMVKKLGKKADSLSHGVREHVKLGPTITETVMGKLSLGARILQFGGVKKVFNQFFTVRKDEKLLKTSLCYLSTTSGPLAGLLFISTDKVSFCSERSIKVFSSKGEMFRIRYKVSIPLKRIKYLNQNRNVEKPTQKYLEIVTEDNFEFWFMGFLKYQKTINYLEQDLLIGFPFTSAAYRGRVNSAVTRMNTLGRKTYIFATGLKEHDTVKRKLSLGARILQVGGVKKVFMQLFSVKEGEKLLKASQCYISTSSGPLAGLLFISTDKVAFCSERSIKAYSSKGHLITIHYKVMIPLEKIRSVNQSQHVKKPSQNYMEIVTVDKFWFWVS